ncbi:hypothetical protein BJL95_05955 [Methylomonas sp. LWB]|uniref:hypothetical protein n=1 Tax=Methylomonas sp. LWB TaxID=1905845 RepID=UPI0008D9599B|nr:hypothetical protein [Methylomonas sp. LWB]OHX34036.1 hypothetical protein BJL95_05955 [Methylomonas sp. LWB]
MPQNPLVCILFAATSLFSCAVAASDPAPDTQALNNPAIPMGIYSMPSASEWSLLKSFNATLINRLAGLAVPDAQGALQRNRPGYFSVRFQDGVTWTIVRGLYLRNAAVLESGIKALEYAFGHQNPDGSFPIMVPPTLPANLIPYPQDYADATTFFFSELGRSLILLDGNAWFQTSADTADLRRRVGIIKEQADRSIDWLLTQQDLLIDYDTPLSNHLYYDGAGFYLVGRALNRQDAIDVGIAFTELGLNAQWPNGVLPELDGYDSSYQGVSLFRLFILYLNADPTDVVIRQRLWDAISSGIAWEQTRVKPSGEILSDGNSRVYPGGDKFLGVEKGISYVNIALSFYYYAVLTGDAGAKAVADKIIAYYTTAH